MSYKRVLIDTNVCLDVILDRKPFVLQAAEIVDRAANKDFTGFVAAHAFDTLFYIVSGITNSRDATIGIKLLRSVFYVAPVTQDVIDRALSENWPDFEDAIHYHSALESGCQAIITRNIRDFRDAGLPVLNPEDFLLQFR